MVGEEKKMRYMAFQERNKGVMHFLFFEGTQVAVRGVEINRFYGASRCRRGRFGIGSVIDHN